MDEQENAVISAAIGWWSAHRPVGWDEQDHLQSPDINCQYNSDRLLAQAVAKLIVWQTQDDL